MCFWTIKKLFSYLHNFCQKILSNKYRFQWICHKYLEWDLCNHQGMYGLKINVTRQNSTDPLFGLSNEILFISIGCKTVKSQSWMPEKIALDSLLTWVYEVNGDLSMHHFRIFLDLKLWLLAVLQPLETFETPQATRGFILSHLKVLINFDWYSAVAL